MIDDAVARIRKMRDRPWLILGKGPSLDLRFRYDLHTFYTFSLNHACTVHSVTVAHFTDLEAFHECWPSLFAADTVTMPYVPQLVMPWVPHKEMGPGHFNLTELIEVGHNEKLRQLSVIDKLWSYNSTRVPKKRYHKHLTEVKVRYFSAVAAFNILALAGVKEICTLGIDGGTKYAHGFDTRDCLANGQRSFDVQFLEITHTLDKHEIDWINLGCE